MAKTKLNIFLDDDRPLPEGLHYRVVPPPLRWRGTLGQPKAGGLFFYQSKFWLDNGAAAWYTRGVNQSRRI